MDAMASNSACAVCSEWANAGWQCRCPRSFGVGPARYDYTYALDTCMSLNGYPVYKCRRDRDDATGCLYLHNTGEYWLAVSMVAPVQDASDLEIGQLAFRAMPGVDIRQNGHHAWQCFDASAGKWRPNTFFKTVLS